MALCFGLEVADVGFDQGEGEEKSTLSGDKINSLLEE